MQWSAPSSTLRCAVDVRERVPILHIAGELDYAAVPAFREEVMRLHRQGGDRLALELSRLTFCAASGARAIYQLQARLQEDGARLEIHHPHSAVRRVLELTGLRPLLRLDPAVPAVPAAAAAQAHTAQLAGVLDAAMHAVNTDMGTAQYFDHTGDTLHLVTHRGFGHEFVSFFEIVRASGSGSGSGTSCGAAAAALRPVFVEDVTTSPVFAGSPELDVLIDAGVGSCVSLPVTTPRTGLLGVVSTHRSRPGPWSRDQRDLLERVRAYTAEAEPV
jgi:anti-anti-sigma factor